MSRSKTAFSAALFFYLVMIALYASVELLRGMQPTLSWLGLLLAAAGPLSYVTWVALAKSGLSKPHPLGFTIISGLGLAMAMTMSWRYGNAAGLIHIWAGLAVIGWVAYLRWFRVQETP